MGLGKPLLAKTVDIAKSHGISRFTGMMDPQNNVIRKTLLELGYDVTYFSRSGFFQVEIVV
jgi:acetyltransferase